MAYFVKLLDRGFNVIGSENWTKTQYTVQSFNLNMKSFEFDEFSLVCEEIRNSDKAVYCGLYDSSGYLIYFAYCGIPVIRNHMTYITAFDLRKILSQDIPINQEDKSSANIRAAKMLKRIEDAIHMYCGSKSAFSFSCDELGELDIKFPYTLLTQKFTVCNSWKLIQKICTYCQIEVRPSVNLEAGSISFVFRAARQLLSLNLRDYENSLSYDKFHVNEAYGFSIMQNQDGSFQLPSLHYHKILLANDDIIDYSEIENSAQSTVYTDNSPFANYAGKCIYSGISKADFRITPVVAESFIAEIDYADKRYTEKIDDLCAKVNECLEKRRYQQSVTIPLNTKRSIVDIYNRLFLDSDGNIDYSRPFTFFGKIYNYNEAEYRTTEINGRHGIETFKCLPVSGVQLSFSSTGKLNTSISFGYLSEFWFLRR